MSRLQPLRACFPVTCPRLDENDGIIAVENRGKESASWYIMKNFPWIDVVMLELNEKLTNGSSINLKRHQIKDILIIRLYKLHRTK